MRLRCLVYGLIAFWKSCGGRVGGGNQNRKGGPLVRFLIATTMAVLPKPPTTETARHWIREYKQWENQIPQRGKKLPANPQLSPRREN
jgi:hypothetical protein